MYIYIYIYTYSEAYACVEVCIAFVTRVSIPGRLGVRGFDTSRFAKCCCTKWCSSCAPLLQPYFRENDKWHFVSKGFRVPFCQVPLSILPSITPNPHRPAEGVR